MHIYYDGYLNVTDLKEFEYCPMIPWIRYNTGYTTEVTPSMELGKSKASPDYKVKVAEELSLPKPYKVEVPVRSTRLGIRGMVDLIAGDRKLVVAEIKAFKRRHDRARHFKTQLAAYALLVNESIGPTRQAILYLGGETVRLTVTQDMLREAEIKIWKLREIVDSEKPPKVAQPKPKCTYCWYRRLCVNASI